MRTSMVFCALLCMGTPALAEVITFDNDETVMIVRGRDSGSDAKFEFLANGEGMLQCVAVDANGKPLAVENTFRQIGWVRFADVTVARIANVYCRAR